MSGTDVSHAAAYPAAVGVGALVALQARINAELAGYVGGGLNAAWISFGAGLLIALAAIAVVPSMRAGLRRLPGALRSGRLPWWHLLGGLGGAWLVTTQGLVVVVVGVTIFTVAVVAGQVAGSLGVDRIGLSPAGTLPVTVSRAVASIIALVAVALGGWSPGGGAGHSISLVVLLALSAGIAISVQQAVNARVSGAARSPMVAAAVNFTAGFTALSVLVAVLIAVGSVDFGSWPSQWWLYLGGPLGMLFIALAAWAVRGLGVLTFSLLTIAGQLLGSVVVDALSPTVPEPLGWPQWAGLALIGVAVVLAARPGSRPVVRHWGRDGADSGRQGDGGGDQGGAQATRGGAG